MKINLPEKIYIAKWCLLAMKINLLLALALALAPSP